jgi:hypothetical protein
MITLIKLEMLDWMCCSLGESSKTRSYSVAQFSCLRIYLVSHLGHNRKIRLDNPTKKLSKIWTATLLNRLWNFRSKLVWSRSCSQRPSRRYSETKLKPSDMGNSLSSLSHTLRSNPQLLGLWRSVLLSPPNLKKILAVRNQLKWNRVAHSNLSSHQPIGTDLSALMKQRSLN